MATDFVSPPEETAWRLDPEAFQRELRARWPGAVVRIDPDPQINYPLSWTVEEANGPLAGSLDRDGQAVTLDGDLDDAARAALWVRGLTPAEQPLQVYDEGYSANVELTPATAADEITRAFA